MDAKGKANAKGGAKGKKKETVAAAAPAEVPTPTPDVATATTTDSTPASSLPASTEPAVVVHASTSTEPAKETVDAKELTSKDYYFDSYGHFGIHEEMLKDEVRMDRYSRAILTSEHLFKGKIVLDVGCGTGVLSMWAAKAGAKHVYGVEMASIHHKARQIVADNGLSDTVTIINGKIEEIELPVPKVDIIISEWMGYFLLYESMLDSVLFARDKWLAPGGLLFPDKASMFICAIEDAEYRNDKIDFWDDVWGFNMKCMKEMALLEPLVDVCDPKQIISNPAKFFDIDLYKVTKEELDFEAEFKLKFTQNNFAHALTAYFTVEFSETHTKINFSTGPRAQYTHWKQTVFYFHSPFPVNAGEELTGKVKVNRNAKNPRDLDIQFVTSCVGKLCAHKADNLYRLR